MFPKAQSVAQSVAFQEEHLRLLEQGWRLDPDGCYRRTEPVKELSK